jgi:hypothetical protein
MMENRSGKIDKIIKNIEQFQEKKNKRYEKYSEIKEHDRIREKEYNDSHDKIKKMIEEAGGIKKFLQSFYKEKVSYSDMAKEHKNNWEFDEEKLEERINYSCLGLAERTDLFKENIKKEIKKRIENKEIDDIGDEQIEEHIKNIIDHELNYNKPHREKKRKIFNFIQYYIGQWDEKKEIFYRLGIMTLIRTEEVGKTLLEDLKEAKAIEGEGWRVEKRTKDLESKMRYIDELKMDIKRPFNCREYIKISE